VNNEKRKHPLAKYQGSQQLLNPSVFNMKKVRQAKIPSANGHASALALTRVFDSILNNNDSSPINLNILELARQRQSLPSSKSFDQKLLMDSSSFGLGFQIHEFSLIGGRKARAVGHSGFGGSIVLTIPEVNLSISFVTNMLSQKSIARKTIFDIIFDEFGLKAPPTLYL